MATCVTCAAPPATQPAQRFRLVFSIDQSFGNGLVINRDIVALERILRAIKTLRPHYDVYALFNSLLADKQALDLALNTCVRENVPFVFDVLSSDGDTLGTSTKYNAPADGAHGLTISLKALAQYHKKYPQHLAGLRVMEVCAQDFVTRAIKTTNPEWNTTGCTLPEGDFFVPELARDVLRFAAQHRLFVQWSDWHWYRQATWDEPQKENERQICNLFGTFGDVVTVTLANNEPAGKAAAWFDTWYDDREPFVTCGARGIGLSDQAWIHDPEEECPIETILAWARRAMEFDCRYIQFEPVWYFFELPRGTFSRSDYTTDPKWKNRGQPRESFNALRNLLLRNQR